MCVCVFQLGLRGCQETEASPFPSVRQQDPPEIESSGAWVAFGLIDNKIQELPGPKRT